MCGSTCSGDLKVCKEEHDICVCVCVRVSNCASPTATFMSRLQLVPHQMGYGVFLCLRSTSSNPAASRELRWLHVALSDPIICYHHTDLRYFWHCLYCLFVCGSMMLSECFCVSGAVLTFGFYVIFAISERKC